MADRLHAHDNKCILLAHAHDTHGHPALCRTLQACACKMHGRQRRGIQMQVNKMDKTGGLCLFKRFCVCVPHGKIGRYLYFWEGLQMQVNNWQGGVGTAVHAEGRAHLQRGCLRKVAPMHRLGAVWLGFAQVLVHELAHEGREGRHHLPAHAVQSLKLVYCRQDFQDGGM